MAPKKEPGTSRTVLPSLFTGPLLGTKYQIIGGSGVTSHEERGNRLNDEIDFIPKGDYRAKDLRDLELIPRLLNDIVAKRVWPRLRAGSSKEASEDDKTSIALVGFTPGVLLAEVNTRSEELHGVARVFLNYVGYDTSDLDI